MSPSEEWKGRYAASQVARIFGSYGVDNACFGPGALRLVGRPAGEFRDLEFVIPDEQLVDAMWALDEGGFIICNDAFCKRRRVDRRATKPGNPETDINDKSRYPSIACAHFHTDNLYQDTLWWLSNLNIGRYITVSSDPDLPPHVPGGCTGPWSSELYPVKILRPSAFTEAVILLAAWGYDSIEGQDSRYWRMIRCLMDNGNNDPTDVEKQLAKPFQYFWENLHAVPNWEPVRLSLRTLRTDEIVTKGVLPPRQCAPGFPKGVKRASPS
ncbi:uncharacterized protein APUU_10976A [Aspergillus puulaauensis]|uniref:Uncharacterized protein n=1 Tax=Aspergillus puulaauensis TaxID=1220207 RepID=A0A7R7XBG7_9EURO|nr:uncharacterized protein APUU_10976A [Aspergillus puulaauensis]BCS18148.1 hypothetical protein APUU_10976A [Aspergillus puulaauensis]